MVAQSRTRKPPAARKSRGGAGGGSARGAGRRPRGEYLLGALVGAIVFPVLLGTVVMVVLFYAEELAGYDTGNDSVSSLIVGSMFASPVVGIGLGVGFVAWRRRRRGG